MEERLRELVRESHERSLTYSFLARSLSDDEITVAFLEALCDSAPYVEGDLGQFISTLAQRDLDNVRLDLAADHAALLLGMSATPVMPYESVYRSDDHLMMGFARDQVCAAYAKAGMSKDEGYHVPEDHVSLELDFMAVLAERVAIAAGHIVDTQGDKAFCETAGQTIDAQLDFLKEHLLVWLPLFCDALEEHAMTAFYRGIAQMLRIFISEDEQRLINERSVLAQL